MTFEGETLDVLDWSTSGFLAAGYSGEHIKGDRVDIAFSAPMAESPLAFRCEAIVQRVDSKQGQLAGVFAHLDPETRLKIAEHFEALEAHAPGEGRRP